MNRSNCSARPRRGNPTGSRLQGHPTLFTSEILPPFRRWAKAPRNSNEDIEVQSESVFRWPADTWHADCRQIVRGRGDDYFRVGAVERRMSTLYRWRNSMTRATRAVE